MGRHFNLRAYAVLGALVVALFGCVACGGPAPDAKPAEEAAQVETHVEEARPDEARPDEARPKEAAKPTEPSASDPAPVDPSSFAPTDVISTKEIERAGGPDAFFRVEEISDAVFARMEGKSYGPDCTVPLDDLRYVRTLYVDAEGVTHAGELVVNAAVAEEVRDIFRELYDNKFPIRKMRLVDDYGGSDEDSCSDGNTSAFNYRNVPGTYVISNHSFGLAIDVNTFENPYYIPEQEHLWPPEAVAYLDRTLDDPYMIHPGDVCYEAFVSRGWQWGGEWPTPKDYQHFEKPGA